MTPSQPTATTRPRLREGETVRTPAGRFATIVRAVRDADGRIEVTLRYEDGDTVSILAKHLRGLP